MSFLRFFFLAFTGMVCLLLGALFAFFYSCNFDFSSLNNYAVGKPSILLDDQGKEWTKFQVDRRDPVSLPGLPKHVIDAFIAAEDHAFWQHQGISWRGIARSLWVNATQRKFVQGASTITQQLVKLLFFDSRKTVGRKLKEQVISLLVERQFSKEHILQAYLNHIYFGAGIYGIEAASQRFWCKSADQLDIQQAATLAGIVKSPNNYCPLTYLSAAQSRRNVILKSMMDLSYITKKQYEQSIEQALELKQNTVEHMAPHARESIRVFLEQLLGKKRLYEGGLVIQTTFNRVIQKNAQKAFDQQLQELKKKLHHNIEGALICMETETGQIKALIGGTDISTSQFNRALQARRQFGSIFKPVVYATALQQGTYSSFADTEIDEEVELLQAHGVSWRPQNASEKFEGEITLAHALSHSNNIVSIKALLKAGPEKVAQLAKKFHVPDPILPYPSLALGCVEGTPKDALGMFNVFANDGVYVEPHYLLWIKNSAGEKIWKHPHVHERVLSSVITSQITKVLGLGMDRYRARFAGVWFGAQAIGKTGTTNDSRTCWFAGASPSYSTVVYIGADDNYSLGKEIFASQTAFPIWLSLNRDLTHKRAEFMYDGSLKEILVNDHTGKAALYAWNNNYIKILVPQMS